jgi:hypothetical protein
MEVLQYIADHAGDICQIATCAALVIKPIREWLMGTEAVREGQRCLLRAEIVRLYYRHREEKKLREYEYKLLEQCYKAYKVLGGNSFIDHIYAEMQEWEII